MNTNTQPMMKRAAQVLEAPSAVSSQQQWIAEAAEDGVRDGVRREHAEQVIAAIFCCLCTC